MSECYLTSRGRLTKLREKNVITNDINAEFKGHEESQLSNCDEISSDVVKGNSGRGRSRPPPQTKRKTEHKD